MSDLKSFFDKNIDPELNAKIPEVSFRSNTNETVEARSTRYEGQGFEKASTLKGTETGLLQCLTRIREQYRDEARNDTEKQTIAKRKKTALRAEFLEKINILTKKRTRIVEGDIPKVRKECTEKCNKIVEGDIPKVRKECTEKCNKIEEGDIPKVRKKSRKKCSKIKEVLIPEVIAKKDDSVSTLKGKIDVVEKKLSAIKRNPESVTQDKMSTPNFYVGLCILIGLTVYLFTFYTSASYSAFFKIFKPEEIELASSLFDGQALPQSWERGWMALVFIVFIPVIFLALGFVAHALEEGKGKHAWKIVGGLFLTAFLFDALLAYEITEKIYEIKSASSFEVKQAPYSVGMALQSANFWIIIFAGFVVYIIWGLLFGFTMNNYSKMNALNHAIRELKAEISRYNIKIADLEAQSEAQVKKLEKEITNLEAESTAQIKKLEKEIANLEAVSTAHIKKLEKEIASLEAERNAQVEKLEKEIANLDGEISKHEEHCLKIKRQIDGVVIDTREFNEVLHAFLVGWLEWMQANRLGENKIITARQKGKEFITTNVSQLEVGSLYENPSS